MDEPNQQTRHGKMPEVKELDALLRTTAAHYHQLETEARALFGKSVTLSRVFPALPRQSSTAKGVATHPSDSISTIASLFARASTMYTAAVVPLAARLEDGEIAIYEPYQDGHHPASARTSIGTISGDWVRRRSDGIAGTPDILLDLEYEHEDPHPQVMVEITWVGPETVYVSGGTPWSTTRLVSGEESIGLRLRSLAVTAIDGWVKLPLTVTAGSEPSVRYDVWMRTTPGGASGPGKGEDDDLVFRLPPTPLPVPVPSPTPTGIPTDIFAALDPDRWRQIEDRLGQFIRDTVGAFEGVLSRVDILTDRIVLRDVSTALRERLRG